MGISWELNALGTILSGVLAIALWALKLIHARTQATADEALAGVHKIREEYVHKSDVREMKEEMNKRFDKLENLIFSLTKEQK